MKTQIKRLAAWIFALTTMGVAVGCRSAQKTEDVVVYMPDGAPAMAFAKLMKEDTKEDGVTYRVVSPAVIATKVANADMAKNADICALPVTAASKLLGCGEKYKMLSVVTGGNLFILSNNEEVKADFAEFSHTDLSHLIGKTVGVMKINEVPGLTFKSILNEYGVAWQQLGNDGAVATDKVNLLAIADATSIDPMNSAVACYVVAEPAASVQIKKNGFVNVCDLKTLYNKGETQTDGYNGYPQAVLMAKTSLIEERADWIADFTAEVEISAAAVSTLDGEEIVSAVQAHLEDKAYTTTLNAGVLTADVVGRCGVHFSRSETAAQAVKEYLQRIIDVNPAATKTVGDEFFYFNK